MKSGYIYIDSNVFSTLFAVSNQEQQQGLMEVKWPPPVMSFIYDKPQLNKFWMSRTPSPLDIVFCRKGEVISIHKGEPFSTSVIGPEDFSDLVIEFPYGTIASLGVKIKNKVGIVSPSLQYLYSFRK